MKVLISLLVLVFVSEACRGDDSHRLSALGMTAFQQHDYNQAIVFFSQAVRANTNYLGAYYFRAMSYLRLSRYDRAIEDFSHALALNTNDADAYYFRGWCYLDQRQYGQSITDLNSALSLGTNITVLLLRAYVYSCATDYNSSIEDYNQAIYRWPASARAHVGRAQVFILQGAYGLGLLDCDEAIGLDPRLPTAYQERGNADQGEGNFENAIADYSDALQLDPDNSSLYYERAEAFAGGDDFSNAVKDLTVLVQLRPHDASAFTYRGWCRTEIGDYRGAIADCRKAILLDTNSIWGYNNLAWILAVCPDSKFRDGPTAVENAKKACNLSGWKDASCIDTLAAAYAENGDFKDAIKWETQAIKGLSANNLDEGHKALHLYEQGLPYRENPNSAAEKNTAH